MSRLSEFLLFLALAASSQGQFLPSRGETRHYTGDVREVGEKLLLSPLIKEGRIRQARDLSLVTGLTPNVTSYAGFITVNEECDSNHFYWFFPSQQDWLKDPVALWLNGGPGATSMWGLLTENGPFTLTRELKLEPNEFGWTRNASVIYIDQPVRTGFSYTGSTDCLARNETQVGKDLLAGLEQFFQLFPELSKNPFYITGESYGGKYVPALAYTIYKSNSTINLQGFAIGNGLTDPVNQQNYADYLYQIGFVDGNVRDEMYVYQQQTIDAINQGLYMDANIYNGKIFDAMIRVGMNNFYNYIKQDALPDPDIFSFLDSQEVRTAVHVGNATMYGGMDAANALGYDVMQSIRPWLEELMEKYRVVLYYGQLDIICAYPIALDYINALDWSGTEEYKTAERKQWRVDDQLAGYSKTVGRFSEVLVRNAGHLVPADQPAWALQLFNNLVYNQPF